MKIAVVTGGTSGMGLGVARMLISKGYYVYATYVGPDFTEHIENFEASGCFTEGTACMKKIRECLLMNKKNGNTYTMLHPSQSVWIGCISERELNICLKIFL